MPTKNDIKNIIDEWIKVDSVNIPTCSTTVEFNGIPSLQQSLYTNYKNHHWKLQNISEEDATYAANKKLCAYFGIRKIVKNGPALVVFWNDDSKTIVKRKDGEKDDNYYAFCAALAKKVYGNNSQVKSIINMIEDETKKNKNKNKKKETKKKGSK